MIFQIIYVYVDSWDASNDELCAVELLALDEQDAIEKFRADYGSNHIIQCVIMKR